MGGQPDDAILASALDLAARGFRIFPLKVGGWTPAVEGWQALATTDETQIRNVWSRKPFNIGVCGGDGLLIVDADMKKGKDGVQSLAAMGVRLSGFVVETPSGGFHGYYRGPDVGNNAGRLGEGIDIRSKGGYAVGPGSILADGAKDGQPGGVYRIVHDGDPQDAPPVLVQKLVAPIERTAKLATDVTPDEPAAVDRAIAYLETAPLAVEGSGGDHTTYTVAARVKDFGVSRDVAVDLLAEHWNDRCSPPWDHEDLKTKVSNAYDFGTSPLGIHSPAVDFAGVKIEPPIETNVVQGPSSWFRHGDARGKVAWLYRNLLPLTGVAVMLALSQAGKTFLLIELARSLATGKGFFKVEPKHLGGTLFVFAGTEGSGLALRLDALGEEDLLPISATIVGNLSDKGALDNLLEALKAEAAYVLERHGIPVRLIVIETLAASGLLQDENDNSEASRAMANLAQISRAMNALVITSHHPAKDGKGSRGASAIPNSADYVIEIIRHDRATVREVELTKARDAEQRKLGSFTLVPVDLGVDEDGDAITSMSVSMGDAKSGPGRIPPHTEKFLEALEWCREEFVDVDGRQGVEISVAKNAFKERKGGSMDRSNIAKVFNACLTYTDGMGRTESLPWAGSTYIIIKERIETDD